MSQDGREPLLEAMRQKLRTEDGKQGLGQTQIYVEPAFAEMKWDGRKLSMDLRDSMKVRGEFSLMCLAYSYEKDCQESARWYSKFAWKVWQAN